MAEPWRELIGSMGVWQRKGERAPHKPLLTLLLLARAQNGGSRRVRFAEVDERLRDALRAFGPPRRSVHPEFPFWYLQNDGFWIISNAESLPSRKGKRQPTRRALLDHDVMGEVPAPLWAHLLRSPAEIPELASAILRRFWPESWHPEIASFFGLDLEAAPCAGRASPPALTARDAVSRAASYGKRAARDPGFRDDVLRAYERRCAICGYDARLADSLFGLDAAHIQWHASGGPDVVANGVALCSLHHVAFDRGAIGISKANRVVVSQDVNGSSAVDKVLVEFHGAPLRPPLDSATGPAARFVQWHHDWVFRSPARP